MGYLEQPRPGRMKIALADLNDLTADVGTDSTATISAPKYASSIPTRSAHRRCSIDVGGPTSPLSATTPAVGPPRRWRGGAAIRHDATCTSHRPTSTVSSQGFIATVWRSKHEQVVSTVTGRSHSDLAEERNAATFGASMAVWRRCHQLLSNEANDIGGHLDPSDAMQMQALQIVPASTDVLEFSRPNSTIETSDSGLSDSTNRISRQTRKNTRLVAASVRPVAGRTSYPGKEWRHASSHRRKQVRGPSVHRRRTCARPLAGGSWSVLDT